MRPGFILFSALFIACPSPSGADAADSHVAASRPFFRTSVDTVPLAVTVTHRSGGYVRQLAAPDFQVYDNGRLQQISVFDRGTGPLDAALLIDVSGSMFDRFDLVRAAAKGFIDTLRPDDRAAVIGFQRRLRLLADWTSDHQALERGLRDVFPGGSTALYTALYVALAGFEPTRAKDSPIRRQVVIVLTDGRDNGSLVPYETVIDTCRRTAVAVYPIRVRERGPSFAGRLLGRRLDRTPEYILGNVARESGGRVFAIDDVRELARIYQEIATELANQYVLGFVPLPDGARRSFHTVSVLVPGIPGALARTRLGYSSGAGDAAATTHRLE
ncbi:MAG: VWA domain-containing protein [Vicinamibacterales bacterium]